MKKKGLIVATIVMVLVLAVSLTTATYAWFTASNTTIVEGIDFSVGSSSDVFIGVKQSYSFNTTGNLTNVTTGAFGSNTASDFMWGDLNGDCTINGATYNWSNGTAGLGHYINTGLDLSGIEHAVGTGVYDAGTSKVTSVDNSSWNPEHSIIVADASSSDDKQASLEKARLANSTTVTGGTTLKLDYLDIVLGAAAAKDDAIYGINCIITVNPAQGNLVLGMNAAIHVRWSLDGENYHDCDIYTPEATSGVKYSQTTSNGYAATIDNGGDAIAANADTSSIYTYIENAKGYLGQGIAVNDGWASISIPIVPAQATYLTKGTIETIHIQVYIAGYDADCNNDAVGVSSEILINFEGVYTAATGA